MRYRPGMTCYACNCTLAETTTTGEHIPPKGMFPGDSKVNLWTVPSCEPCNNKWAHDDNVILFLAAHADANAKGKAILEKVHKGIQEPGLREKLHELMVTNAPAIMRALLTHPEQVPFALPLRAPNGFMERICKGLLYEINKRRDYHDFLFLVAPGDVEVSEKFRAEFAYGLTTVRRGEGVFRADHRAMNHDPRGGIWILEFYESSVFSVVYQPVGRAKKKRVNSMQFVRPLVRKPARYRAPFAPRLPA